MKLAARAPWFPRQAAVINSAPQSVLEAGRLVPKSDFESRLDRLWRGRGLKFIGFVLLA
jgi:hypothetical protein